MSSVVTPWLRDVIRRELSRARDRKLKDGFDSATHAYQDVKSEQIDNEHSFSFQRSTQFEKYDERRYIEDGSNVSISFPHGLDGGRYLQLVEFLDVRECGTKAILSDSQRAVPTTFSPDSLKHFKKICGKPFTRDTIGGYLLIKDFEIHTTKLGAPELRLSILVKDFHFCGTMTKLKPIGNPVGIYTDIELLKLAAKINESSGSDASDVSPPRTHKELDANVEGPVERRGTGTTSLDLSNMAAACETTGKGAHTQAQNAVEQSEQQAEVTLLGGINLRPPQPSHSAHSPAGRVRYSKTKAEAVTKSFMSTQSNLASITIRSPKKPPHTPVNTSLPQTDVNASPSVPAVAHRTAPGPRLPKNDALVASGWQALQVNGIKPMGTRPESVHIHKGSFEFALRAHSAANRLPEQRDQLQRHSSWYLVSKNMTDNVPNLPQPILEQLNARAITRQELQQLTDASGKQVRNLHVEKALPTEATSVSASDGSISWAETPPPKPTVADDLPPDSSVHDEWPSNSNTSPSIKSGDATVEAVQYDDSSGSKNRSPPIAFMHVSQRTSPVENRPSPAPSRAPNEVNATTMTSIGSDVVLSTINSRLSGTEPDLIRALTDFESKSGAGLKRPTSSGVFIVSDDESSDIEIGSLQPLEVSRPRPSQSQSFMRRGIKTSISTTDHNTPRLTRVPKGSGFSTLPPTQFKQGTHNRTPKRQRADDDVPLLRQTQLDGSGLEVTTRDYNTTNSDAVDLAVEQQVRRESDARQPSPASSNHYESATSEDMSRYGLTNYISPGRASRDAVEARPRKRKASPSFPERSDPEIQESARLTSEHKQETPAMPTTKTATLARHTRREWLRQNKPLTGGTPTSGQPIRIPSSSYGQSLAVSRNDIISGPRPEELRTRVNCGVAVMDQAHTGTQQELSAYTSNTTTTPNNLISQQQPSSPAKEISTALCEAADPSTPLVSESAPTEAHPKIPQPPLTVDMATETLYARFSKTYPLYSGDDKHFRAMCARIENLRRLDKPIHQSLWDDFIIRHKTDYSQYMLQCTAEGEDPMAYEKYYNEQVVTPKYTNLVMIQTTLTAALSDYRSTLQSRSVSIPQLVAGQKPDVRQPGITNSVVDETSDTRDRALGAAHHDKRGQSYDRTSNDRASHDPPTTGLHRFSQRREYESSHASRHSFEDCEPRSQDRGYNEHYRQRSPRLNVGYRYSSPLHKGERYDECVRPHQWSNYYPHDRRSASLYHDRYEDGRLDDYRLRTGFSNVPGERFADNHPRRSEWHDYSRRSSPPHARDESDTRHLRRHRDDTRHEASIAIATRYANPADERTVLQNYNDINTHMTQYMPDSAIRHEYSRNDFREASQGGTESRLLLAPIESSTHERTTELQSPQQSLVHPSSSRQTLEKANRDGLVRDDAVAPAGPMVSGPSFNAPETLPVSRLVEPRPAQRRLLPWQILSTRSAHALKVPAFGALDEAGAAVVSSSPAMVIPGETARFPIDMAENEWYKDDNTPFKEFARNYTALKAFGGALDISRRGPLDVLKWHCRV